MAVWLLPNKPGVYRVEDAFFALRRVSWYLEYSRRNVRVGDTVYLYKSLPAQQLILRALVVSVPASNIADEEFWGPGESEVPSSNVKTSFDLRLEQMFSSTLASRLTLRQLGENGLKSAPQSMWGMRPETEAYVRSVLEEDGYLPDVTAEGLVDDPFLRQKMTEALESGDYAVDDLVGNSRTRGSAQAAFASKVKTNYEWRCAISGITTPSFLVAAHIVPWAEDKTIRLDPANGICLSSIVDRAYETGFLLIHPDLTIEIPSNLRDDDPILFKYLVQFDGKKLREPVQYPPRPELLERRLKRNSRQSAG